MTSCERFRRMFSHREADRVPVHDGPWGVTLERWHREGMPENVDFAEDRETVLYMRSGKSGAIAAPDALYGDTDSDALGG